jgi:hypothetical protein
MPNFVKILPVRAELFHAEGQNNGETWTTKLKVAFRARSAPFQFKLECRKLELQTALSLAGDAYDAWYRVTPPDSEETGRYRISVLLVGHPASYLWIHGFVQRPTILSVIRFRELPVRCTNSSHYRLLPHFLKFIKNPTIKEDFCCWILSYRMSVLMDPCDIGLDRRIQSERELSVQERTQQWSLTFCSTTTNDYNKAP